MLDGRRKHATSIPRLSDDSHGLTKFVAKLNRRPKELV